MRRLNRLPAHLRATIVLCALQGLSYDAAARQLGLTEPGSAAGCTAPAAAEVAAAWARD